MSDFSKVTINGTSYNVKDATARAAAETNAEAISELNRNLEKTILYSGDFVYSDGGTVTLLDDISNYGYIEITYYARTNIDDSPSLSWYTQKVPVYNNTVMVNLIGIQSQWLSVLGITISEKILTTDFGSRFYLPNMSSTETGYYQMHVTTIYGLMC